MQSVGMSPALGAWSGAIVTLPGVTGFEERLGVVAAMVAAAILPALLFGRPRAFPELMRSAPSEERRITMPALTDAERAELGVARDRIAKPSALMVPLIETFTQPGDLILDPFAGTGPVGMAAIRCGRDYLGAEADPVEDEDQPAATRLECPRGRLHRLTSHIVVHRPTMWNIRPARKSGRSAPRRRVPTLALSRTSAGGPP